MLSTWGKRIQSFYEKGYYTKEEVQIFVPKFITQEECNIILGL